MAKDTDKLIRQLSLISYLMAERRPVTATDIRRDVEGYSKMNEDAFARRYYADRMELTGLGVAINVEHPVDGIAEQETYSLRRESFHLPAIAFTDSELAGLHTALSLLDGEFAYAEPLRLALQQLTFGRENPLSAPDSRTVGLAVTASAGGHDARQRLAKIETALERRKTVTFEYESMSTGEQGACTVDPYHLLFRGEFYLLGYCHGREAVRVFRLSRIRSKVSYHSKGEHDFKGPVAGFDPRDYADRADWQLGEPVGEAQIMIAARIAWQVQRTFGRYGTITPDGGDGDVVFTTTYSDSRMLAAWVMRLGEHARAFGPPDFERDLQERAALLVERHRDAMFATAELVVPEGKVCESETRAPVSAPAARTAPAAAAPARVASGQGTLEIGTDDASQDVEDTPERDAGATPAAQAPSVPRKRQGNGDGIRSERFARLSTLAAVLLEAGRDDTPVDGSALAERMAMTLAELREDVNVLNLVNFGGGSYILYAEMSDDGVITVDREAYADHFDRPARLLPVEAKALVAAIDLVGEHLPEGSLRAAREKIIAALGSDPSRHGLQIVPAAGDDAGVARVASAAITAGRMLRLDYYKSNEDVFSIRVVEPYALVNGREGWYVATFDPDRGDVRHFRLDRVRHAEVTDVSFVRRPEIDPAAHLDGWLSTGEVQESRVARIWFSPERARQASEDRHVTAELVDGSVIVALAFKGTDFLVRDVLAEAGDAVVLEPADARSAVLAAGLRLAAARELAVA